MRSVAQTIHHSEVFLIIGTPRARNAPGSRSAALEWHEGGIICAQMQAGLGAEPGLGDFRDSLLGSELRGGHPGLAVQCVQASAPWVCSGRLV